MGSKPSPATISKFWVMFIFNNPISTNRFSLRIHVSGVLFFLSTVSGPEVFFEVFLGGDLGVYLGTLVLRMLRCVWFRGFDGQTHGVLPRDLELPRVPP